MWRPTLLVLALALPACGDGECLDLPSAPTRVDFEDSVIGERALTVVRLTNTCEADLAVSSVTIEGDAAFELDEGTDSIAAGGEVPLAVGFTAEAYGTQVSNLVVETSNGPVTIVLTGRANPDQDGDGVDAFEAGGLDCDDTDPDIVEARPEEVNGRDDDCDGLVDEDFILAGDVVITEIMLTPTAVAAPAGQWIEVKNLGRRQVDLKGWTFSGPSGIYTVQSSLRLAGGEVAVLGFEADTALNGGVELDGVLTGDGQPLPTQGWFMALSVDGRAINVLSDKRWPEEAGRSIGLDPDVTDPAEGTGAEAWCTALTELASGDFATPGARNDLCPQFDHDGDGLSALEGDCDDTDRTINPIATDIWDGIDNDCNGQIDLMFVPFAADGVLQGDGDRLGWHATLVGSDLLVTAYSQSASRLYRVPATSFLDTLPSAVADVQTGWVDESGGGRVGAITGSAPLYDIDADGDDDLVVLGRPANFYQGSTQFDYLWVYEDLPADSMTALDHDDAILIVNDPLDGNSSDGVEALLDLDLDGDGTDDTVFGHGSYKGTIEGFDRLTKGRVWILDLVGQSGRVDPSDVVVSSWTGETEFTGVGDALEGGDINDDGYDDIVLMDVDPTGDMEGSRRVQLILGGMELPESSTFEAVTPLTLSGLALRTGFGTQPMQAPLLADLDQDGDLDLAVPDPFASSVRIFHDASTLTGEVAATDADLTLTGVGGFGTDLELGDIDGDGTTHLLVGAPTNASSSSNGRAYLFASSVLGGTGELDTSTAVAGFGSTASGAFGAQVELMDLDGDGRDEVVVPDYGSYGFDGGLFVFIAPE